MALERTPKSTLIALIIGPATTSAEPMRKRQAKSAAICCVCMIPTALQVVRMRRDGRGSCAWRTPSASEKVNSEPDVGNVLPVDRVNIEDFHSACESCESCELAPCRWRTAVGARKAAARERHGCMSSMLALA
ncbi:hypothetical protein [Verminephrobacter eiseniae]|uniref:hypothetical protein n=2 Tax=Verminephrobacter eiseniae TaxID=364317 RepID=UPI001E5EC954|nr:hypothetical protein [Verminephrobacter eiseniae]